MGLFGGGGEVGFDEGGVLEALNRPFRTKVKETFKYGRKGSSHEGLVTEHITVTDEWAMSDVIAAGLIGAIVVLGKEIADALEENPIDIGGPFDLMVFVTKVMKDVWDEGSDKAGFWSDLFTPTI